MYRKISDGYIHIFDVGRIKDVASRVARLDLIPEVDMARSETGSIYYPTAYI